MSPNSWELWLLQNCAVINVSLEGAPGLLFSFARTDNMATLLQISAKNTCKEKSPGLDKLRFPFSLFKQHLAFFLPASWCCFLVYWNSWRSTVTRCQTFYLCGLFSFSVWTEHRQQGVLQSATVRWRADDKQNCRHFICLQNAWNHLSVFAVDAMTFALKLKFWIVAFCFMYPRLKIQQTVSVWRQERI